MNTNDMILHVIMDMGMSMMCKLRFRSHVGFAPAIMTNPYSAVAIARRIADAFPCLPDSHKVKIVTLEIWVDGTEKVSNAVVAAHFERDNGEVVADAPTTQCAMQDKSNPRFR